MANTPDWLTQGATESKPEPATQPDWLKQGATAVETEPPARGLKGWAGDIAATALKGAVGIPESLVGLADIPTGGRVGKFLENQGGTVGFRPKQAREYITEALNSEATKEAQRKFQEADGVWDKTKTAIQNPSLIAAAVGESLPAMGLGGVAARGLLAGSRLGQMGATGAALAGAAGEGAVMAGSAAEQIRQETDDGLLTAKQAGLAGATGLVGGAFGALGGRLANRLGIGDAETMLAQGTRGMSRQFADDAATAAARAAGNPLMAQQAAKGIPRQMIEGAISEGLLEELPQSVTEQLLQNLALDKPWHEDLDASIVLGTLSGGAMGAGAAGYRGFSAPRNRGTPDDPGAPQQPAMPLLGNTPDPLISFPDGTVGRRADVDAYLNGLPENERMAARARLFGINPQPGAAPSFSGILDTDGTYAGWSNVRDGSDRQTMRDQMASVERSYAGQVNAGNRAGMESELARQFKWFRAATPEQRSAALDALSRQPAPMKPSEAMGLNPATGPLSAGAAVAVDTGVAGGLQQAAAQAQADQKAQASQRTDFPMLEYADLSDDDRAAYDIYFNSVSEQTDDHLAAAISDGDIPDFGDESNVSEVEFLRRMGASEQEILDAIEAASTAGGPQAGARGAAETQTDVADSARPVAGADSQPGASQESSQALTAAERAALQADLDAEQEGGVPGARGADQAFAQVTEDAGAVPADVLQNSQKSNTSQGRVPRGDTTTAVPQPTSQPQGEPSGPQALETQQAVAQPAQAPGAPGAPAAVAPDSFGAQWDAMGADERAAVALRAGWVTGKGGLNPTGRSIVRRSWADTPQGTRKTLARHAAAKPEADATTGDGLGRAPAAIPKQDVIYHMGDAAIVTGPAKDGLEPILWIEGARAGKEGVRPTKEARDARSQQNQNEWRDQQAQFRRLHESQQEAQTPIEPSAQAVPANPKAIERVNAGRAFFFSEPKAQDFIAKNGLADTHEIVQENRAFHVVAKSSAAPGAGAVQAAGLTDGATADVRAEPTGSGRGGRADAGAGVDAAGVGRAGPVSLAPDGAGAPQADGAVDALRQQLRAVEDKIIAAAPASMGAGGGDIEAAMRSRKVPVTLKAQRKALVGQIRAAEAQPATAGATAGLHKPMRAAGWNAETGDADNTIWTKRSKAGETYTARLNPDDGTVEVTAMVGMVDTQIASFNVESPEQAARMAEKAIADDEAESQPRINSAPNEAATSPQNDLPEPTDAQKGADARNVDGSAPDVSTVAGQKHLANRATTIAALHGMNAQLRKIAPNEAWNDQAIADAKDLDALRDSISAALVNAQRAPAAQAPAADALRDRLNQASGEELRAVFDRLGLAGTRMAHAERVTALMAEDRAAVVEALDAVQGADVQAAPITGGPQAKFERLRESSKAEMPGVEAFGKVAGAIGEKPADVYNRWHSFIRFHEALVSGTGAEVAKKMAENLLREPYANPMAYPAPDRATSLGTLRYAQSRMEAAERENERFQAELDLNEMRAADAERFGASQKAIDTARAAIRAMRQKAAENMRSAREFLEKKEADEKAAEAAAEKEWKDSYSATTTTDMSVKPTPASISSWGTSTYNGAPAFTNGHIVDVGGSEPHLKGWENRKNSLRPEIDADSVGRVMAGAIKQSDRKATLMATKPRGGTAADAAVFSVGNDEPALFLDSLYVRYFLSKYRGAEFLAGRQDEKGKYPPAVVMHNGKVVGVISPVGMNTADTPADIAGYMKDSGKDAPPPPKSVPERVRRAKQEEAQARAESAPAPKPRRGVAAKAAEAAERARADYFTPGNIVHAYGGKFDRVVSYTPATDDKGWRVVVRAVQKQGDAWVDVPGERDREHMTQPSKRELNDGPIQRAPAVDTEPANQNRIAISMGGGELDVDLPHPAWQMTREEVIGVVRDAGLAGHKDFNIRAFSERHGELVDAAIKRGAAVPDKVLAGYPGLIRNDLTDDQYDLMIDEIGALQGDAFVKAARAWKPSGAAIEAPADATQQDSVDLNNQQAAILRAVESIIPQMQRFERSYGRSQWPGYLKRLMGGNDFLKGFLSGTVVGDTAKFKIALSKADSSKALEDIAVKLRAQGGAQAEGTQFPMHEAARSYSGISHQGNERAQSDADEFERFISAQQEAGLAVAETEDQKAAVARAVETLRADYVTAYRRLMGVRANTYSAYVAGRSGLNSRQANRSNSALDKAMEAFSEWQTAASGRVRRAALDARTDDQKQADQQAREQTEADKAQRREDADRSLIRKILTWKKGGEAVPIGKSATLSGVNLGRDGYPSSVNLKPNDGSTLTSDKFDLAALFRRDGMSVPDSRRRVRELVDAVRAEDAAQTSGQDAAPASAPTSDSKTPMMDGHVDLLDRVREGKATADQIRESFARMDAGRDALEAELNTMSKDKLLRSGGYSFAMRHRDSKKAEVVSAMVDEVLDEYSLGRSYGPTGYVLSAGAFERHKQARAADLRELVAGLTDEDIAQFARQVAESRAELQARREATQQALENPQTLADFRAVISSHMEKHGDSMRDAYLRLTPEQRARYDDLEAEGTKARREQAKAAAKAAVAAAGQATVGEVIATRHTKLGHDLFVVQLAERVSREDYETLNASAKRMGGSYSSYRGNGAIPGFQFRTREAAEAFSKLVAGDEADAQAVAQARRDAFEDDRSQSAVERLRAMAAALNERADEQLGRERKTNTARRARFAASAEGAALADKALAGTMNNLAAAIEAGTTKFLDAVRQKVQVEMLGQYLRSAKDAQIRAKYPSYGDQQKHRGEPVDAETVDYAEFPTYVAMRSDLASIARQMLEVDGLKQLGQRLMSVADDVSEAYTAWAKDNLLSVSRFGRGDQLAEFASREDAQRAIRRSGLTGRAIVLPIKRGQNRIVLAPSEAMKLGLWEGDGDKRITLSSDFGRELVEALGRRAGGKIKLPWTLEATLEKRKRLEGMGIYTAPEFRSALREFSRIQQAIATPDKIKEMERAMIGRANDGLDFFPTSPDVVQSMLDAAEIQDGMAVLEPSAGMGHIADAIVAQSGVWPDVVELSPSRRELLEAKGYHLAEVDDFTQMEPRKFFTYGDTFRAPDGVEGIMHGVGHMGSQRVRLEDKDGNRLGLYNRDELTGIAQNGTWSGYDRIIMNPPFSDGRDIQHVQHAYELLRPGGRIVAIMGEGAFFQSNKRAEAFREWLEERGATSEKLPEGSFMDPSLPVNTSVNARMVVIDKPVAAQEGDANFGARQRAASGTPTDRAVMDMAREGKSAQDILRLIAGTSKSRFNRQVARLLLRTGVTPKVEALAADGLGKDKRGFNLLAKYNRDSNTISLTEGAGYMAEQIMLHELIHAATLRALDRKGLAALQMKRLFAHVQKQGVLDGTYGMKNVGEFVSEAFTNPDFQRELRKIKGVQDGGRIKAAWDGFVRILRSILGLPNDGHDALSRALDLGVSVMREQYRIGPRGGLARGGRDAHMASPLTSADDAERAAVEAATYEFWENLRIDEIRSQVQEEYDQYATVDEREISTDGLELDEDGELTDAGQDAWYARVQEAIDAATRERAGQIESMGDVDRLGTHMQAYQAAMAWLDAMGVPYRKLGSAGSRYLEVNSPEYHAGEDSEESGHSLKLRFANHATQSRQHTTTGLSWVSGDQGMPLADMLDAAQRFASGEKGLGEQYHYFGMADARAMKDGALAKSVGDGLRAITQTNIKQLGKHKLTDWLNIGLQFLGRRQLVDIYGGTLPMAEYDRLAAQMEADKNDIGATADELARRWGKLPDEARLADLMNDATLAQIDADSDVDYVSDDDKAQSAMLKGRFKQLTPEAQKVYREARDHYKAHHEAVKRAIVDRINRSELRSEKRAEIIKRMEGDFFKSVRGVYFPLARFGEYVVVVHGSDGKVVSVSRAETMDEANAMRQEMLKAFPTAEGYKVGRVQLGKEFLANRDMVGRGFMTELYEALDRQGLAPEQQLELEDTLGQLYLSSLPDLSWAKHGIHRKGTPGFSQDARRAFAQNTFHGARYLAKLKYSDLMQNELARMQKHVDDWAEVGDFDQPKAQRVVNEMNKRHDALMNPKSNPISTALTSVGFVFYLGLLPAAAAVNLSQTALVAYPVMGARWGFKKAGAALMKASEETVRGMNDLRTQLKDADEIRAYDEAVRIGAIDVTNAHDLAGIAQGEDAKVMWKMRPVMRAASFMFHHAERFNRQATFIAAYRLARDAGAAHQTAFEQAVKATYDGHFDYSSGNRPRVMQGNVARVVLLFKQFGQNMIYTVARNAYQSVAGETPEVRKEARKVFAALMASHAAAAGVLGLPLVGQILALASALGGSDDEPWDAEVALRNMLADAFGPKASEVMAKGLSRLTPWDISGRVGLDNLIFPDVQEGIHGQRMAEAFTTAALGPVVGMGVGAAKAAQQMAEGNYLRGLEDTLPLFMRNPLKAARFWSEGAVDKTGIVVKDEVGAAGALGQAVGFSPAEVRLAFEGRRAVHDADRRLNERRSDLMTQFARAAMDKDERRMNEARAAIAAFNEKNPGRRITAPQMWQSVRNRQRRIDQAEQGVYLPRTRRDAMEAAAFALTE